MIKLKGLSYLVRWRGWRYNTERVQDCLVKSSRRQLVARRPHSFESTSRRISCGEIETLHIWKVFSARVDARRLLLKHEGDGLCGLLPIGNLFRLSEIVAWGHALPKISVVQRNLEEHSIATCTPCSLHAVQSVGNLCSSILQTYNVHIHVM